MSTIWKYELTVEGIQDLYVPGGGKILCVQVQRERPCVWMLVNPDEDTKLHRIWIFGTGQPDIDTSGLTYIGTFQLYDGGLVFHVFDGH